MSELEKGFVPVLIIIIGFAAFAFMSSSDTKASQEQVAAASETVERDPSPTLAPDIVEVGTVIPVTMLPPTDRNCCYSRIDTDIGTFIVEGRVSTLNGARLTTKQRQTSFEPQASACVDNDCYSLQGLSFENAKGQVQRLKSKRGDPVAKST